ncbi:MAG: hypothetical protein HFG36_08270 [Eubacterium sp.]|nr:hypothetical protein [Eubacterium sp.]
MKYIIEPTDTKELGFCNNSGCKKNACNNYTNSSCSGNTKINVSVKVK